jgi:secondary thiamine-phosphate synthase enzyme
VSISQHLLTVETEGQGLHEVTRPIAAWVAAQSIRRGLLTIFIRHTSAALVIQENAAPAVRRDLDAFMKRLAPEDPRLYTHNDEGEDDMPAHIRTALLGTHLAVPVEEGRLLLGTWQGIYVFEHRRRPHRRELVLHLAGE